MKRAGIIGAGIAALLASPALARRPPPPPTGTLTLDLADPVIRATVAGVPLRLRVALDGRAMIELNPAAAARLPLRYETGTTADIGRETLAGIAASAPVELEGRRFAAQISSHGRDCCAGVDGAIGPTLLPYALVRLVRAGTPDLPARTIALTRSDDGVLEARGQGPQARIALLFALDYRDSGATAAGGAILARAQGGRYAGAQFRTPGAFGIDRPARMVAFARAVTLAGFRFDALPMRIADYAGHEAMPADPAQAGEIVVRRRALYQAPWPLVVIGRDRLDRCAEIAFATQTLALTLRCAFDAP